MQKGNISKSMAALSGIEASFLLSFASIAAMKPWFSNFNSKVLTTVSKTT